MLLGGGDPAAWPNAEMVVRHLPELSDRREREPALTSPDTFAELDGLGARLDRHRTDLTAGRWHLPNA